MNSIFQIFVGTNGQYYFRLKSSGNREIILSSEGYPAKTSCQNGIASVKTNSLFDSRYNKRTAANGQYYFVLTGANGETIGISELYWSVQSRDNGITAVKRDAPYAMVEDLTTQKAY